LDIAQDELKLAAKMVEWEALAFLLIISERGQWEYFGVMIWRLGQ
jgi:hypothetical protein